MSTVKVRAALTPVFAAPSDWDANAAYVPSGRAGEATTDHDPSSEDRVVVSTSTGSSETLVPS